MSRLEEIEEAAATRECPTCSGLGAVPTGYEPPESVVGGMEACPNPWHEERALLEELIEMVKELEDDILAAKSSIASFMREVDRLVEQLADARPRMRPGPCRRYYQHQQEPTASRYEG